MDGNMTEITTCEAAVVGAGGAGLAAALLLARARRDVIVIDGGKPRNAPSAHARDFLSRDSCAPTEVLGLGRQEVTGYGARILDAEVRQLDNERTLHLVDGRRIRGARVILATGLTDVLPEVPGVAERWGRDVLHCPYCHAHDVGQNPFVVLGTHPYAVHHSILLRQWSPDVTFVVHEVKLSDQDRAAMTTRGVRIFDGRAEEVVVENDAVTGVRVRGTVVPCAAVFLFPAPRPRDQFTAELSLHRDSLGFPVVDPMGCTSVPWLYAAGNAADPRFQALAAAGHGQQVAHAMHNAWVAEEVAATTAGRRP